LSINSKELLTTSLRFRILRMSENPNNNNKNILIEFNNVDFFYGNRKVLDRVNLSIYKNKVTSIIGPSGSGKSTLLNLINRICDEIPESRFDGKLYIDGKNIFSPECDVCELRKKVGMIFQKLNPFPTSILENIAFGIRLIKKYKKNDSELLGKIEAILHTVGLWNEVKDRLNEPAYNLSPGQQQRLCIARALIVEPLILLMDEPMSDLDQISSGLIEELVISLKNDITFIIATHNLQQAARISDFTGFLFKGRLLEYGKTSLLFTKPSDILTEKYITGRF